MKRAVDTGRARLSQWSLPVAGPDTGRSAPADETPRIAARAEGLANTLGVAEACAEPPQAPTLVLHMQLTARHLVAFLIVCASLLLAVFLAKDFGAYAGIVGVAGGIGGVLYAASGTWGGAFRSSPRRSRTPRRAGRDACGARRAHRPAALASTKS